MVLFGRFFISEIFCLPIAGIGLVILHIFLALWQVVQHVWCQICSSCLVMCSPKCWILFAGSLRCFWFPCWELHLLRFFLSMICIFALMHYYFLIQLPGLRILLCCFDNHSVGLVCFENLKSFLCSDCLGCAHVFHCLKSLFFPVGHKYWCKFLKVLCF